MADSNKTKVILAILGLIGGLSGAVITNWEKLNPKSMQPPPSNPVVVPTVSLPPPQGGQAIQGHNNVQISGSYNVISSGVDSESKAKLGAIDEKATAIENKTDVLVARSERQPQIAMAEFVRFNGKKRTWSAPNKIYPGSIVELHGFSCSLIVRTDAGFVAEAFGKGWSEASEIVIVGHSGEPSKWSISANGSCEGKVIVFSSPRIRSIQRSWSEEGATK